jgi:hypothetical protein
MYVERERDVGVRVLFAREHLVNRGDEGARNGRVTDELMDMRLQQDNDRVVAWNDKGERVSLYIRGSGGGGGVKTGSQGTERSHYSSLTAHSARSAVEEYEEEIQPEVVRRQWVALGGIFLLLLFVWLWALNGGPLAALWAHN